MSLVWSHDLVMSLQGHEYRVSFVKGNCNSLAILPMEAVDLPITLLHVSVFMRDAPDIPRLLGGISLLFDISSLHIHKHSWMVMGSSVHCLIGHCYSVCTLCVTT